MTKEELEAEIKKVEETMTPEEKLVFLKQLNDLVTESSEAVWDFVHKVKQNEQV